MKKVGKNKKVIAVMVMGLLAILLAASGVIAVPFDGLHPVASKINYQGQLTDLSTGDPLDGTYTMRFQLYDDATVGTLLWDSGGQSVDVDNGLFNVKLDVDQSDFNGQELWLEVRVEGETFGPRQEILPVPYALSLKPGAKIEGNSYYGLSSITTNSYGLYGESSSASLGAGVIGENTGGVGDGIQAVSNGRAGIAAWGEGANSYAGYFFGNVHITEDLTAGPADVSLPIAYAFINSSGTVASGTSNVSSAWSATHHRYEITITGEDYSWIYYVTIVTPTGGGPRIATTGSVDGKLVVYIFDSTGNKVQNSFQFVTYKP